MDLGPTLVDIPRAYNCAGYHSHHTTSSLRFPALTATRTVRVKAAHGDDGPRTLHSRLYPALTSARGNHLPPPCAHVGAHLIRARQICARSQRTPDHAHPQLPRVYKCAGYSSPPSIRTRGPLDPCALTLRKESMGPVRLGYGSRVLLFSENVAHTR